MIHVFTALAILALFALMARAPIVIALRRRLAGEFIVQYSATHAPLNPIVRSVDESMRSSNRAGYMLCSMNRSISDLKLNAFQVWLLTISMNPNPAGEHRTTDEIRAMAMARRALCCRVSSTTGR
jgi:hypothetical protein